MKAYKQKILLFITAFTLSFSALAVNFEQTSYLADKGYSSYQFNLGLMYALGDGVNQDNAKAAEWYRKAANQGKVDAQYNLATMYGNGEGVRQNFSTAKEWYGKVCDSGDQGGCDEYKKLNLKGF